MESRNGAARWRSSQDGSDEQIFGANQQDQHLGGKLQRSGDGGAAPFGALVKLAKGNAPFTG